MATKTGICNSIPTKNKKVSVLFYMGLILIIYAIKGLYMVIPFHFLHIYQDNNRGDYSQLHTYLGLLRQFTLLLFTYPPNNFLIN